MAMEVKVEEETTKILLAELKMFFKMLVIQNGKLYCRAMHAVKV
jgi:hypothetical protein